MLEAIIAILGTTFVGSVAWVFHSITGLETRVSVIDSQYKDLTTLIESRFDDVSRRLDRIERGMNGHLPKD
jgi:hypothetical protein